MQFDQSNPRRRRARGPNADQLIGRTIVLCTGPYDDEVEGPDGTLMWQPAEGGEAISAAEAGYATLGGDAPPTDAPAADAPAADTPPEASAATETGPTATEESSVGSEVTEPASVDVVEET